MASTGTQPTVEGPDLFVSDLLVIAKQYGTPVYVVDFEKIQANYNALANAIRPIHPNFSIRYAAKANSNLAVMHFLKCLGSSVDCASEGEILCAKKAGFGLANAIYTGVNVTDQEFALAAENDMWINLNSISELRRLLATTSRRTSLKISMRYNPGIGHGHKYTATGDINSKFGLFDDEIVSAYQFAKEAGCARFGIHMHIGSGGSDSSSYLPALEKLLAIAKRISETVGVQFEFIDIGGGLPVPYKESEARLDPPQFFSSVLALFQKRVAEYKLGTPTFCIEPGRYIVCDAGMLLLTVNTIKRNQHKNFIGVDGGMNLLIRPPLYGAHHEVLNLSRANNVGQTEHEKYDVVGPICENADFIARDRSLPETYEGDVLSVLNTGAYGYCMSSNYNMRMRPAEIGIYKGKSQVIREADDLDEYLAKQHQMRIEDNSAQHKP